LGTRYGGKGDRTSPRKRNLLNQRKKNRPFPKEKKGGKRAKREQEKEKVFCIPGGKEGGHTCSMYDQEKPLSLGIKGGDFGGKKRDSVSTTKKKNGNGGEEAQTCQNFTGEKGKKGGICIWKGG